MSVLELDGFNMIEKDQITIPNSKAYKLPNPKMVTLTVKVAMDMVPGWGHEPEDHIQFIMQNPYVQSITVERDLVIDSIKENKS